MIARGFKPVGWVAAAGAAALGCYMVSLNVAAERAELLALEARIVRTKQDIRSLHTELGTRGRLAQLDRWNAEVLALSAPTSAQFLQNEFTLARFDRSQPSFEDRARIQMASADTGGAHEAPAPAETGTPKIIYASASTLPAEPAEPAMLLRKASQTGAPPKPVAAPATRKAGLLDDGLLSEIGSAATVETGGAGDQ